MISPSQTRQQIGRRCLVLLFGCHTSSNGLNIAISVAPGSADSAWRANIGTA
jgi:hypothetical protein